MPIRIYKNLETGEERRTLKSLPAPWEEVITAPGLAFMIPSNKATGKSKIRGLEPILKARARNHSRDHDLDDQVAISNANGMGHMAEKNLLNSKGERRRKIDDL